MNPAGEIVPEEAHPTVGARVVQADRVADAAIAVLLGVVALVARRDVLPRDGLGHDDSWVALSATRASMRQLLPVGFDHPGFTLGLHGFSKLVGGPTTRLAYPVFAIGVVVPIALYLALRRFGYARSICVLLAAAAVSVPVAVEFSGDVKTYVLDALVVLGLIAVLPRLVAMEWRWYTCVFVTATAVVLMSLSVFALVATLTALAIVALEGRTERLMRVVTALVVALVGGVFVLAVQRTYSGHALYLYWRDTADAYVQFSANPLRLATNIVSHVARNGAAFPGGPTWLAGFAALVAIVGVIVAAVSRNRSSQRERARYVALLVLVALIGSIAKKFVFGPTLSGVRVALWMLPILALGLAITMQFVRTRLRRSAKYAFDGLVYVVAAAVLLSAALAPPLQYRHLPYRHSGPASATHWIESQLGPHDAVLIVAGAVYSYAAATRLRVRLKATPKGLNSFVPVIRDPRVHDLAFRPGRARVVTPADQRLISATLASGTARVFVYDDDPRPLSALYLPLEQRAVAQGYAKNTKRFQTVRVITYSNSG